jgi:hypothetical protein
MEQNREYPLIEKEMQGKSMDLDNNDYDFGKEGLLEEAKKRNLQVVLPKDNELFIDLDSEKEYQEFKDRYQWFVDILSERYGFQFEITADRPSKSGLPRRHIIIEVSQIGYEEDKSFMKARVLNPYERICLQFCLNSDMKRERLSTCRMLIGDDEMATAFLEKKVMTPPLHTLEELTKSVMDKIHPECIPPNMYHNTYNDVFIVVRSIYQKAYSEGFNQCKQDVMILIKEKK